MPFFSTTQSLCICKALFYLLSYLYKEKRVLVRQKRVLVRQKRVLVRQKRVLVRQKTSFSPSKTSSYNEYLKNLSFLFILLLRIILTP
jgi:hypothetical protein